MCDSNSSTPVRWGGRHRCWTCLAAVTLVLASRLAVPTPSAASGLFLPPFPAHATGLGPCALAIADLDHDGDEDVAVANNVANTVSILLGDGTGNFAPKVDYGAGNRPQAILIRDLDGDGDADLAVPNSTANTVSVLLGNGDGTFGARTEFAAGSSPHAIATGDINGDLVPDLVVANANANTVSVLLGNDDGTFAAHIDSYAGRHPVGVTVGDFDGDGNADAAVANWTSPDVSVLFGNGDGTFRSPHGYPTMGVPSAVTTCDLDHDGDQDLATNACAFLNQGDGTFTTQNEGWYGNSIAVGDIDGQGDPDLVAAQTSSDEVGVYPGRGDGWYLSEDPYAVGDGPVAAVPGDLNGDGGLDLVVANSLAATVSILLRADYFTITATAEGPGTILPSGAVSVLAGESRSFTITPSPCSHVVNVFVDGISRGPITSYTFANVHADHTIHATFANLLIITATTQGNGSISPSGNVSVPCGSNRTFSITPDPGYSIANVLVDGVSHGAISSYTFMNVQANHTIRAYFGIAPMITTSTNGHGHISPEGAISVPPGSDVTFTILPDTCYRVADVIVDGVSQGACATYTFTNVQANHTIRAVFAFQTFTIFVWSDAGIVVSPSGSVEVACGGSQTFTFTPLPCCSLFVILVDGVTHDPAPSYTFTNVQAGHVLQAYSYPPVPIPFFDRRHVWALALALVGAGLVALRGRRAIRSKGAAVKIE